MCQRHAAFGHHLHQVSQAQLEAKIPAYAQDDDLAVEVATLEQLLDAHQLAHAHPSGSGRHHSGPDPAVCTRAELRGFELMAIAACRRVEEHGRDVLTVLERLKAKP